jgi:hypothetical protein
VTVPAVSVIGRSLLPVVFAQEESVAAHRADTGQMLVWLLVAGAAIGVVSVVLVVANRIGRRWRYNSHPALFCGLCKVHGLDSSARRLLKRAMRFHRLRHPGRLFIEPKWLDPANLSPAFQPQAAELERLRNRLFHVRSRSAKARSDGKQGRG